MIQKKIEELKLDIKDLEIYSMTPINFGMRVDNQIRPILNKHLPTDTVIIEEGDRSHLKNLLRGLEKLKEKI